MDVFWLWLLLLLWSHHAADVLPSVRFNLASLGAHSYFGMKDGISQY